MSLTVINGFRWDQPKIGIPSGREKEDCIRAFEDRYGLEVPDSLFSERAASQASQGNVFVKIKSYDGKPWLAAGWLDLAVVPTDVILDTPGYPNLVSERIGAIMCDFSLIARPEAVKEAINVLNSDERGFRVRSIPTSRPNLLNSLSAGALGYPFFAGETVCKGNAEYPLAEGLATIGADIVQTGNTLKINGLVKVETILPSYPEIVTRREDAKSNV